MNDLEKKLREEIAKGKNVNEIKREIRSIWPIKNDYEACQSAYRILDKIAGRPNKFEK